jgi:hypothetical protein
MMEKEKRRIVLVKKASATMPHPDIAVLCALAPEDNAAFEASMLGLWDQLTNPEERPAGYNKGGQLQLMDVYANGSLCLDHYLGMDDLIGEDILCKITFARGDGLLHAADVDAAVLVAHLNAALAGDEDGTAAANIVLMLGAAPGLC